ncbi:MAG: hypothetical protein D3916_01585 [Candidatus Electrothrix sp. MAN1_4]|nr:hypothetical protein [Candidatus Electrothrix sp. MAN1_4]
MKGVIVTCLESLVKEQFGQHKWEDVLEEAGLKRHAIFNMTSNVQDESVMQMVQAACTVLEITPHQAADAFGDYWVNVYAPKVYSMYYRKAHSAKEMLLNMDKLHETVTSSIPDAHPPRFDYEWKDEHTLIMHYKSHRGMIDFLVGLIKGVGTYYNEDLRVTKQSETAVEVVFLGQSSVKTVQEPAQNTVQQEGHQSDADSSVSSASRQAAGNKEHQSIFQKIFSFFK